MPESSVSRMEQKRNTFIFQSCKITYIRSAFTFKTNADRNKEGEEG